MRIEVVYLMETMYQIPELLKHTGLFHAFSTKQDGDMANSIDGKVFRFEEVLKNRKKFLSKVGVSVEKSVCMWVVQGDEVAEAKPELGGVSLSDLNMALRIDGLVTNKSGLYLFLLVADCLPIILYDHVKGTLGLVHAGWKGVDLEIAKKAINKLKDLYDSNPDDLTVGVGPCARKGSFIKKSPNQKNDLRWQPFLEKIEYDNYKVDFVEFCKKQIRDAGVRAINIFDCGIDTVCDKRFFSHVREHNLPIEKQGRFACVVGMY